MRREGRQHGMVRTHLIVSAPWNLNELSSPPTAGMFNKVSTKPTNHSKFTSKCGRPMCRYCHDHPACKSKDKVKGAHKARSGVMDAGAGLKLNGLSATAMLDYMVDEDGSTDYYDDGEIGVDDSRGGIVDDDDKMSFCEVGFVWLPLDGDESWCLVEQM